MRYALCLIALILAAVPAAADPFHHPNGEWREYHRDWLAACPDEIDEDAADYYGFSCFASTGSQEVNAANLPAYKLTIMHNRLNGELDVAITLAADTMVPDVTRPIVLTFGGEAPLTLDFSGDLETRYNTGNVHYIADQTLRDLVLERMLARNGVTLDVPVEGRPTMERVRLSLRGVAASIDFMAAYARRVAQY